MYALEGPPALIRHHLPPALQLADFQISTSTLQSSSVPRQHMHINSIIHHGRPTNTTRAGLPSLLPRAQPTDARRPRRRQTPMVSSNDLSATRRIARPHNHTQTPNAQPESQEAEEALPPPKHQLPRGRPANKLLQRPPMGTSPTACHSRVRRQRLSVLRLEQGGAAAGYRSHG